MLVDGGRLPTHRAWPDCRGFRGGPLRTDVCRDEFELVRLTAALLSSSFHPKEETCIVP